jgi:hypothetical protein
MMRWEGFREGFWEAVGMVKVVVPQAQVAVNIVEILAR